MLKTLLAEILANLPAIIEALEAIVKAIESDVPRTDKVTAVGTALSQLSTTIVPNGANGS